MNSASEPAILASGPGRNGTGREALTARESDVLERLRRGESNREVGEALGISQHTVARHAYNLFRKLGVSSRLEAASLAIRADADSPVIELSNDRGGGTRSASVSSSFWVAYQPIVSQHSGELIGFEAFLRDGATPGAPFGAEDRRWGSHEMRELSLAAVRDVVRLLRRPATSSLKASVNIHPAYLTSTAWVSPVQELIGDVGGRITFELAADLEDAGAAVRRSVGVLRKAGASFYRESSSTDPRQARIPPSFDGVKIDAAVFDEASQLRETRIRLKERLIEAVRDRPHSVIATSVEAAETVATAGELGVAAVQGHLLGRPVPRREALRFVSGSAAEEALTVRQREVLRSLADGRRNRQIAVSLRLSEATVAEHVAAILRRLGARSRVEAIAIGYERGLLD